jgi:hypothetical protein
MNWVVCFIADFCGRDSSVGIAIRYGLNGSGFQPRGGGVTPALMLTQPPVE